MAVLAASIWDLDELASAYRAFNDRWRGKHRTASTATEPLARELLLGYEWLELLRRDPRLPQGCLPSDWPAARAQRTFKTARAAFATDAELVVATLIGKLDRKALRSLV
jgi:phenylacetic acid degradation operon negative regulatory protein